MPYEIVKSVAGGKNGFRVKKKGTNTFYSKKALPKKIAEKQRTAIILNEMKNK